MKNVEFVISLLESRDSDLTSEELKLKRRLEQVADSEKDLGCGLGGDGSLSLLLACHTNELSEKIAKLK